MDKKEPTAPAAVPRETLVTTEGVTVVTENQTPAAPETKEKADAQDTRRPARQG